MSVQVTWVHQPSGHAVQSDVSWNLSDPLALRIVFRSEDRSWVVGRDLIADAFLEGTSGRPGGDISCAETGGVLYLRLMDQATLVAGLSDARRLWDFLNRTYRQVPRGTEELDIDSLLDECLGGEEGVK
jgi:hypothetical protein